MKVYMSLLLALAAFSMAEASPNLQERAGCSQKGQYCNGGTFLCCPGQGSCSGNVVSLTLHSIKRVHSDALRSMANKAPCSANKAIAASPLRTEITNHKLQNWLLLKWKFGLLVFWNFGADVFGIERNLNCAWSYWSHVSIPTWMVIKEL